MIYLICIDADGPEGPGKRISEWVHQTYESSAHPLSSCWIVDGPLAADQIHTALSPLLAPCDRLIIVKAATAAIWHEVDVQDALPFMVTGLRVPWRKSCCDGGHVASHRIRDECWRSSRQCDGSGGFRRKEAITALPNADAGTLLMPVSRAGEGHSRPCSRLMTSSVQVI